MFEMKNVTGHVRDFNIINNYSPKWRNWNSSTTETNWKANLFCPGSRNSKGYSEPKGPIKLLKKYYLDFKYMLCNYIISQLSCMSTLHNDFYVKDIFLNWPKYFLHKYRDPMTREFLSEICTYFNVTRRRKS